MAPVGYVGVSPKCILGFNKVITYLSVEEIEYQNLTSLLSFYCWSLFALSESWRRDISPSSNWWPQRIPEIREHQKNSSTWTCKHYLANFSFQLYDVRNDYIIIIPTIEGGRRGGGGG